MAAKKSSSKSSVIQEKAFVDDGLKDAKKNLEIVDLFAGIGGFHYGIAAAAARINKGVKPLLVSEIEQSCQDTYANNHKTEVLGDINSINLKDFRGKTADIVTAGFPCQPFSNSGKKLGLSDPRGQFYFKIEEIIKHFGAKSFILENVPGIRKNGGGHHQSKLSIGEQVIGDTMHHLEQNLLKLRDYSVRWIEIDSSELGSPQVRKRVYIIGVHKDFLNGEEFNFIPQKYQLHSFIDIVDKRAPETLALSKSQEKNLRSFMKNAPSYKDGMRRVGQAYLCDGGNVGQGYHASGMVPTLTKVWARFLPIYFPGQDEATPEIGVRDFKPDRFYGQGTIRRASVKEVMRLQGFPDSFKPHQRDRLAYEHAGNAVNAKIIREITENLLRYIK
jgi:DNA (cytosine-5)-methyltransferase 1